MITHSGNGQNQFAVKKGLVDHFSEKHDMFEAAFRDFDQCYHELFAPDADAYEMPGFPMNAHTKGVEALLAKSKEFAAQTVEVHAVSVSDPLVQGNTFAIGMMIDRTDKERGRSKDQEICAYVVKDGKITSEHFVYPM